jgi:uncharacterized protein (DUF924 family)
VDASYDEVLAFWFPDGLARDAATLVRQAEWWFRGGADEAIVRGFSRVLELAERGELDDWSARPRSRLALIIVLDQFSRSVYRGSGRTFWNDPKALSLALAGIASGQYAALETPWEKTFFILPLGHSEQLEHLEHVVQLTEDLVREAREDLRTWFEFSASQARGNRDVIARFGRHPHRNESLGRQSTQEELEYLARGEFVHARRLPR